MDLSEAYENEQGLKSFIRSLIKSSKKLTDVAQGLIFALFQLLTFFFLI